MIAAALGVPLATALVLSILDGRRRLVQTGAIAGLGTSVLLLCLTAGQVFSGGPIETVAGGWPAGVGIRLRVDALGIAFAVTSVAMLLAALVRECSSGIRWRAAPALLAFAAFGMTGLCFTADAFSFYVFFEVAMIAAVALSAYSGAAGELRAAFIFAVVNAVGSVLFLAAVAALYHTTATLDMPTMAQHVAGMDRGALLPIAATLFVAFGLKLGLFPFHFWVPPVYRDAAPMVAAVLSGAIANIGSYGLLRFGSVLAGSLELAGGALVVMGALSVIYGSLLALSRPAVGEVLAYSSVAQAGYILLAIGLGSPAGLAAAVVYALLNSLAKTLLFLAEGMRGALAAGAFLLAALSVAGVPPAAGFFGKAALVRAASSDAAVLAVLFAGGLLSIAYMAAAFRRRLTRSVSWPVSPPGARWTLGVLALIVLAGGLWPEPLLQAGRAAAAAFLEVR